MIKYRNSCLVIDVHKVFSTEDASTLFDFFQSLHSWNPNRRQKLLYGDPGLEYKIVFKGKPVVYPVKPWIPEILHIKSQIEALTGDNYTVCVVHYYPNGSIGINPHRDKEMIAGTTIVGLSLGAERTLEMSRGGKTTSIPLYNGSIYILYPPTNDFWAHCIPKDETSTPRISLTFRNYKSS